VGGTDKLVCPWAYRRASSGRKTPTNKFVGATLGSTGIGSKIVNLPPNAGSIAYMVQVPFANVNKNLNKVSLLHIA
jgi:hypothetical protein